MTTYRIERMTMDDYHKAMCGYMDYNVEHLDIKTNTIDEALALATANNYVVNKKYVRTLDEIEAETEARKIAAEAEKAKKAEAEARKIAREAEKAAAAHMTIEEYRAAKKEEAKARRYAREIVALENEIAELKKEIEYRKKWLEKRA